MLGKLNHYNLVNPVKAGGLKWDRFQLRHPRRNNE